LQRVTRARINQMKFRLFMSFYRPKPVILQRATRQGEFFD